MIATFGIAGGGRADVLRAVVFEWVAVDAARQFDGCLRPHHLWIDLNSTAPAVKVAAPQVVESAGAPFVDDAVMSAVRPRRMANLVAGDVAVRARQPLAPLGFDIECANCLIGAASAIRLACSMLVKGVEALLWECAAVTEGYSATERVFTRVGDALGNIDWVALADDLMRRTLTHGHRRSEELLDVVESASNVGVEAVISAAGTLRLATISGRLDHQSLDTWPEGFSALLDQVEGALRP